MARHLFRVTLEVADVANGAKEVIRLPLVVNVVQAMRLVEDYALAYSEMTNPYRLDKALVSRVEVEE